MQLSTRQSDALSEMINIGFGRAANALSVMVGERVFITVPLVKFYALNELLHAFDIDENDDITTVMQVFTGRIDGVTMLLLDQRSNSTLIQLLGGVPIRAGEEFSAIELDTMREIGNIVLSAFTSSFGSLLNIHISFTVPHIHQHTLAMMLDSISVHNQELEYALLVRVEFRMKRNEVSGYVVIVLGVASLEALLDLMRAEGFL
jgi:chemotaxis protein CheC